MAEMMKKELDVKDFEMTSTVEDSCFVNIPEDEIKMENIEVQGKFKTSNIDNLRNNCSANQKLGMNYKNLPVNNYKICFRHTCF